MIGLVIIFVCKMFYCYCSWWLCFHCNGFIVVVVAVVLTQESEKMEMIIRKKKEHGTDF